MIHDIPEKKGAAFLRHSHFRGIAQHVNDSCLAQAVNIDSMTLVNGNLHIDAQFPPGQVCHDQLQQSCSNLLLSQIIHHR
jgi:hypothetical protein